MDKTRSLCQSLGAVQGQMQYSDVNMGWNHPAMGFPYPPQPLFLWKQTHFSNSLRGKTVPKHLEAGKPKLPLTVSLEEPGVAPSLLPYGLFQSGLTPPRGLLTGHLPIVKLCCSGKHAQRLQRVSPVGRASLCWGPRPEEPKLSFPGQRQKSQISRDILDLGRMSVSQ